MELKSKRQVSNLLNIVFFTTGIVSAIAIVVLIMLQYFKEDFQFWPPPNPQSWQKKTFRALFRVFFYSLVVLSFVDFQPSSLWRYVIGGALLFVGIGLAMHWTGFLGWRNSFGEPTDLKTTGPFAWSRNPVYMATILGMMGWAIATNSALVSILLALWALLYIVAPFVEEPWLQREFGKEYRIYMDQTPRYFRVFR